MSDMIIKNDLTIASRYLVHDRSPAATQEIYFLFTWLPPRAHKFSCVVARPPVETRKYLFKKPERAGFLHIRMCPLRREGRQYLGY
ncbi:MAG: hypothetical protein IMZ50_01025 [Candidatus Atribacteria bacterium]|nr:hypothetical protein [Candidatus Atribacteria bacterium]